MSVIATVTLDSGFFLPHEGQKPYSSEIGYFETDDLAPDIRIYVDGREVNSPEFDKLGKNCIIKFQHKDERGAPKRDGVTWAPTFHDLLLHLGDLYEVEGKNTPKQNFDCILRFEAGYFCASMVKSRTFKKFKKGTDGKLTYTPGNGERPTKPIAHDVLVQFELGDKDDFELARVYNGETEEKPFFSSKAEGATTRIDIELIADKSMVEKFYSQALEEDRDDYWLPNQPTDPPPSCTRPPCPGQG